MSKLSQVVEPVAGQKCDQEAICSAVRINRREAVRQVGTWVVYLGALGGGAALASCAAGVTGANPTPTGNPTPTPTATPTGATPTPTSTPDAACGCGTTPSGGSWTNLGLAESAVPMNGVAYNSGMELYVCHDSTGFYVMTSICTHASEDMGSGSSVFSPTDLSGGFTCPHHSATFDANGNSTSFAPSPLQHYALTTDNSGNLWANTTQNVSATCRC